MDNDRLKEVTNRKAEYIKLYDVDNGYYTLALGTDDKSEILHEFLTLNSGDVGYLRINDKANEKKYKKLYKSIDISNLKYLENIKKYCYFGTVRYLWSGGNKFHNMYIQEGLSIVVDILLKVHITDAQLYKLNTSYKMMLDIYINNSK